MQDPPFSTTGATMVHLNIRDNINNHRMLNVAR
jgi:hypothetical protein